MKAAILGTAHAGQSGGETAILRNAGFTAFQQMAGYVPQTMPITTPPFTLPPVTGFEQLMADAAMSRLCGHAVRNCNRRVPYLILAWLLVGSDNEFRVAAYVSDKVLIRTVTLTLLRCAMGEPFTGLWHNEVSRDYKDNGNIQLATETIDWVIMAIHSSHTSTVRVVEHQVFSASQFTRMNAPALVEERARSWCYIHDDKVLLVIQKLFMDALSLEDDV